ncbi:DUF5719 family protein [Nocardioides sp. GY 10127]|uniref:DUF5719 family protein n=1 Tax=Nocardioides sp. GY 10127 TaxID=2569762 RepID=UPI0010A91CFF|nr:DUF5719 family protein [Nocardioides sp. GY 10127]TIC84228.1 hypothetical protein E8D37_05415 [Nocardioides sp. GY 10127]
MTSDDQTPEQTPDQAPEPTPEPTPEQVSDSTPEPAPGETPDETGSGRRRAAPVAHGPSLTGLVVAAVLVVVTVVLALLVHPADGGADAGAAPDQAAVTSTDLTCPEATDDGGVTIVSAPSLALAGTSGTTDDAQDGSSDGSVTAGGRDVDLATSAKASASVGSSSGSAETEVAGVDGLAPGLSATRTSTGSEGLAATVCPSPTTDQWFTGLGASPAHSSVIVLHNPDAGTATADLVVHSADGDITDDSLRGVSVPAGGTVRLRLAKLVAVTGDLAVEVSVDRGRLAVSAVDTVDRLAEPTTSEYLSGQSSSSTRLVLAGVAGLGSDLDSATLVVHDAGTDSTQVSVQLVSDDATFDASGTPTLRLSPDEVGTIDLTKVLSSAAAKDAVAVVVTADQPLTGTLRLVESNDLVEVTPATTLSSNGGSTTTGAATAVALSGTSSTLVLTADGSGDDSDEVSARVTLLADDGSVLSRRTVKLAASTGTSVAVPAKAAAALVEPLAGTLRGAVVVGGSQGDGAAVLGLSTLPSTSAVPHVQPGDVTAGEGD